MIESAGHNVSPLRRRRQGSAWHDLKKVFVDNRVLLFEMTRRELTDQHRGQAGGIFWQFGHAAILVALYVGIFTFVFATRMGGADESGPGYPAFMLSGLVPWLAAQAVMTKAVGSITAHANLVKQVVFPLEVLPIKGVLAATAVQIVTTVIVWAYVLLSHGHIPGTALLLPLLLVFQTFLFIGMAMILATIGVYLRDIRELVAVATQVSFFILPIIYVPEWVPPALSGLMLFHPLSHMIWVYQDVLYFGAVAHPVSWFVFVLMSLALLILGLRLFRQQKPVFASVL